MIGMFKGRTLVKNILGHTLEIHCNGLQKKFRQVFGFVHEIVLYFDLFVSFIVLQILLN